MTPEPGHNPETGPRTVSGPHAISPDRRQYDEDAPTLTPDESIQLAKMIRKQISEEQIRTHERTKRIMSTLAVYAFGITTGVAATAGYFHMKSSQSDKPTSASISSSSANNKRTASSLPTASTGTITPSSTSKTSAETFSENEVEEKTPQTNAQQISVDTPEKLQAHLVDQKIRATTDVFPKMKFISAVLLGGTENQDGGTVPIWVDPRSEKMQEHSLVAIKVDRPEYIHLLEFTGNQPVSKTIDPDDPTILYAYYRCSANKLAQGRGAGIGVMDPTKIGMIDRKTKKPIQYKYLNNVDLLLATCPKDQAK